MFGTLVARLDDPDVAAAVVSAIADPRLTARLELTATEAGVPVADVMATAVRSFLDTASDDQFVQLIGAMNRAEDPGMAAVGLILRAALLEIV